MTPRNTRSMKAATIVLVAAATVSGGRTVVLEIGNLGVIVRPLAPHGDQEALALRVGLVGRVRADPVDPAPLVRLVD